MRCHRVTRPGLLSLALALAASLGFGQSASAGWRAWPGRPDSACPILLAHDASGGDRRDPLCPVWHGPRSLCAARGAMSITPMALDRRGYRISFAVDAYNGRVLESFIVRQRPYGAGVPLAPGYDVEQPVPQRSRRAMLPRDTQEVEPGPRTRATPKREQRERATVSRQPSTQSTHAGNSAPEGKNPCNSGAAGSSQRTRSTPAEHYAACPGPELVRPGLSPPQSDAPSANAPARQAGPVSRVPEPLIDPRDGAAQRFDHRRSASASG
jgi:hypothetical protein